MIKFRLLLSTLLFAYFISIKIYSQEVNSQFNQSPNAASLGIYGNIDISPFTGLADIGVKVFSLQEGDIPVNCELRYYSGGVKPASHPGWTGSNWTLNVGAVVTRKVNGGVDEVASSDMADQNAYSYLYHYNLINPSNWYTNNFMGTYYDFKNNDARPSLAPDEFMFTLPNGTSGSFFLNHEGKWVVKSKSGDFLKVEVAVNSSPFLLTHYQDNTYVLKIKRLIYLITIIDGKGFKYTFGNTPNAIEFNRGPRDNRWVNNEDVVAEAWYLTKIESPKGSLVTFEYARNENQYVATTSYPSSGSITLYTSSALPTWLTGDLSCRSNYSSTPSYEGKVITPSYLSKITSSSFTVNFNKSVTTELRYPNRGNFGYKTFMYDDLEINDVERMSEQDFIDYSKWYELDNITISNSKAEITENFSFQYTHNTNQRLFLQSFSKTAPLSPPITYSFDYDTLALPPYNSKQTDQWGYYNGKVYPENVSGYSVDQLLSFLTMDPNYAQAGMLKTIHYPTGGTSNFYYEPNDYSLVLQKNGNNINLGNQNGIGGGLRIQKIIDNDGQGHLYQRIYQYIASSNNLSSGILAGYKKVKESIVVGNPVVGSGTFLGFNDVTALDYTDGKEVVYSEVKELLADGSYSVFKYSNSDNVLYRDETPINIYSNCRGVLTQTYNTVQDFVSSYTYPHLSHTSRELERGLLLSKETYNKAGILLLKTQNIYNDDPGRFNQFVRSFDNDYNTLNCGSDATLYEHYYQPIKIYTYYPYLKTKIEYLYNLKNETGNDLVTTTSYQYNGSNQPSLVQVAKSDGSKETKILSYATDYSVGTPFIDQLTTANIISTPIEEVQFKEDQGSEKVTILSGNISIYQNNSFGLKDNIIFLESNQPVPLSDFKFSNTNIGQIPSLNNKTVYQPDTRYRQRVFYDLYDNKGKILQYHKLNEAPSSMFWGYNGTYPVAEIKNAAYADVVAVLGQAAVDQLASTSPGTDAQVRQALQVLRTDERLKGAMVTTYTYAPLIGMTSKTDENNVTTYYEYDELGRLKVIKDKDGNIVKKYNYNYQVGQR